MVAFNVARSAYKGGKQANQIWKEAEKKREEKMMKEGKRTGVGTVNVVAVGGEVGMEKK